jgi:hypothetical protein
MNNWRTQQTSEQINQKIDQWTLDNWLRAQVANNARKQQEQLQQSSLQFPNAFNQYQQVQGQQGLSGALNNILGGTAAGGRAGMNNNSGGMMNIVNMLQQFMKQQPMQRPTIQQQGQSTQQPQDKNDLMGTASKLFMRGLFGGMMGGF